MAIPYIGKRFNLQEFKQYIHTIEWKPFRPNSVTIHHTAMPSLAMRPKGFLPEHLLNLKHYYGVQLGWSGAPHLFVDDQEKGIIVFQVLNQRGVHAKSFNRTSLGLEMLGDYDHEAFVSGRGAKVRDNALAATAALYSLLKLDPKQLHFHREDPLTRKTCPGKNVSKVDFMARLLPLIE